MLLPLLITSSLIFALLLFWTATQAVCRRFAEKHPELGPPREEGLGCGLYCGCLRQSDCPKKQVTNPSQQLLS